MTNPFPAFIVAPFFILLAAIALAPLFFPDWWGRHFGKFTAAVALVTLVFYLFHSETRMRIAETGFEYLSFICLIGSLFVSSGGIHITVKGEAAPLANVLFLLIGALTSNLLGKSIRIVSVAKAADAEP